MMGLEKRMIKTLLDTERESEHVAWANALRHHHLPRPPDGAVIRAAA